MAKKEKAGNTGKRVFTKLESNRVQYLDKKNYKKGFVIEGEIVEIKTEAKKGKFAEQKRVVLKTPDEKKVCLPSHYTINDVLVKDDDESKMVGSYVRVTYIEQTTPAKGKKGVHVWEVELAS